MNTTVKQILDQKGAAFQSVRPTDSVFDALSLMAQHDIGSVLVIEHEKLVGIFTERDYARKVVLKGLVSRDVKVGDLMTKNPYTIDTMQTADTVRATMTAKRFRHIPVVEDGKVLGIVTIGDMVKSIVTQQEKTIKQLESYIAGDLAAE